MKKRVVVGLLLAFVSVGFIFAGGGKEATSGKADEAKKAPKVAVVLMALDSEWWHTIEDGAYLGGHKYGLDVTVMAPRSESDVEGQVRIVEDVVTSKVDAIIIAPCDTVSLKPVIEKAYASGIKILNIDTIIETDLPISFYGVTNYTAAQAAGEYLAKLLQPGAEVAIIRGAVGLPDHDQRVQGASDVLTKGSFKVVAVQPADSSREKALSVAENILQKNPDIAAFFATNDEMALGSVRAIGNLSKKIHVIGFDGATDAVTSIYEKKLTASVSARPFDIGEGSIKIISEMLAGKEFPKNIDTGFMIIDQDNIKGYKDDIESRRAEAKKYKK